MKRKAIVAALLLFVVGFTAFAEVGMYFKGLYGRGFKVGDWGEVTSTVSVTNQQNYETTYDIGSVYSTFETMITPSFGIRPWADSGNTFLRGLSFEFGLEFAIGNIDGLIDSSAASIQLSTYQVFGITPSVMAVFGHQFGRAVPYVGLGVSVPILINWALTGDTYNYSETQGGITATLKTDFASFGFNAAFMAGVGYAVSESFMPVFELGYGIGTSQSFSARIGAVFTIKGGGNGRSAPPPPPPLLEAEAEEVAE